MGTKVVIYYVPGEHQPAGGYIVDNDAEIPDIINRIKKIPIYAYVVARRDLHDQMGTHALLALLDPNH